MGVKDLWNVISPIASKSSLYDLQDKTIAIDLSCWVCEGQCVGESRATTQPRMYLRNLFFRTSALLMLNVTPVFVLDGEAPLLKQDTIKQRNEARFKARHCEEERPFNHKNSTGRSRFKGLLKQCRTMLELMGVTCLQSAGEAEALCGQLNNEGLVDGVITQDSDAFLYGARTVYRNLVMKAGIGTIDVYKMDDIEKKLNLNREKLVAMSLLCGCDYDQAGVHGIGKETASKYLMSFEGDILDRLLLLRIDQTLMRYEEERGNCTKCCHQGKAMDHRKNGCSECYLAKGCRENDSPIVFKNLPEHEKKIATIELNLRKKAVAESDFPNQETIKEFLYSAQYVSDTEYIWKKPCVPRFCAFCGNMLEWALDYAFEKILPLLTRWQLLQMEPIDGMDLVPISITKKRVVKGVPSLDIGWEAKTDDFKSFLALLTDDCKFFIDGFCLTTEPQLVVSEKMETLYLEFVERTTKVKKPKRKDNKDKKLECVTRKSKKTAKSDISIDEQVADISFSMSCLGSTLVRGFEAQHVSEGFSPVSKEIGEYRGHNNAMVPILGNGIDGYVDESLSIYKKGNSDSSYLRTLPAEDMSEASTSTPKPSNIAIELSHSEAIDSHSLRANFSIDFDGLTCTETGSPKKRDSIEKYDNLECGDNSIVFLDEVPKVASSIIPKQLVHNSRRSFHNVTSVDDIITNFKTADDTLEKRLASLNLDSINQPLSSTVLEEKSLIEEQESWSSNSCDLTVDESTVQYDLSEIIDEIVSIKMF